MRLLYLGVAALLGISAVAYGKLYPRDGVPKGDCLEMMCASGVCMENDKLEGSCCPKNENLPKTGENCNECGCLSGECNNGKCGCKTDNDCEGILECDQQSHRCVCPKDSAGRRGTVSTNKNICCLNKYAWNVTTKTYSLINHDACGCPSGMTEYSQTASLKNCCANETHVLIDVVGSISKVCCPKATPKWDAVQQKCVGCLVDADCEGDFVCLPNKICGCPSGMTEYSQTATAKGCCAAETHVLADIAGSANKVCCPKATPQWDAKQQKCVECFSDGDCQNGKPYCGINGLCEACPNGLKSDSRNRCLCYSYTEQECPAGQYCHFSKTNPNSGGVCTNISDMSLSNNERNILSGGFSRNVVISNNIMNWWSASSFCIAHGKRLLDLKDFGCYLAGTSTPLTAQTYGSTLGDRCCKSGQTCPYISFVNSSSGGVSNTGSGYVTIWGFNGAVIPEASGELAKYSDKYVALNKIGYARGESLNIWTNTWVGSGEWVFAVPTYHNAGYIITWQASKGTTGNSYKMHALCD